MLIAWIRPALSLLRLRPRAASVARTLHRLGADPGLRRWLRELYPNSREVQCDAAIPAAWLAVYVAIGILWHSVHAVVSLAALPLTLLNRFA